MEEIFMTENNNNTQAPLSAEEQTRYDGYMSSLWDHVRTTMATFESASRFDYDFNRAVSTMRLMAPDGDVDLVNAAAEIMRSRIFAILLSEEARENSLAEVAESFPTEVVMLDRSSAPEVVMIEQSFPAEVVILDTTASS
jgi:hypothetical protein